MAELLSADLDGELSEAEQKTLQEHLLECSHCRRLQQQLGSLEKGFGQLPEFAPPALKLTNPAKAGRHRAWGLLATAAAAGLAWVLWDGFDSKKGRYYLHEGGTLAASAPASKSLAHREFELSVATGRVESLQFEIHVDSHLRACQGLHLEVAYDFEGDGKVDRVEQYASFDTDAQEGWQVYASQSPPLSSQGEMRPFKGGKVTARLKNAHDGVQVKLGPSHLIFGYS
jgi:hypothetical protein